MVPAISSTENAGGGVGGGVGGAVAGGVVAAAMTGGVVATVVGGALIVVTDIDVVGGTVVVVPADDVVAAVVIDGATSSTLDSFPLLHPARTATAVPAPARSRLNIVRPRCPSGGQVVKAGVGSR